ncbi:coproporphyrinogen III oxidase [Phormidium tenue FACHB-886]|nr:coproporphyrinogen III oxidase [Phormidium tenue FACHB-886]
MIDRPLQNPLPNSTLQKAGSSHTVYYPVAETLPTAAYIHIPFCRRRCFYCDFPISIVGDRPPLSRQQPAASFGTIAEYVEVLCQEILATPKPNRSLETVFLGGGTPSLLLPAQLGQILETLDRHFGIASTAEISMEIDPDTIELTKLQGYRQAGINRVSLGAQAFQLQVLQACGRTHTPDDIRTAVELLHQVNLENFSLDLISGLPHLTLELWQESIEAAIALSPTHLSVYDLTLEPGTAFDRRYKAGVSPLPTDELTTQMYRTAQQRLIEAGFSHYEISNYAKAGFQCQHNRVYWENRPYYGFGMAAASYTDRQRFTRPRKRPDYYHWVQAYAAVGGRIDCAATPDSEVLLDTLMLGLRLAEGLSLNDLEIRFGGRSVQQILKCLQPYQQQGWIEVGERLRLTDPEGFLFSNVILSKLFGLLSED